MTRVAVLRPDDGRVDRTAALVESLGFEPVRDPMLAVDPTGALPRTDADCVVLTSVTGVELLADAGWDGADSSIAAIGPRTAGALADAGYAVDLVPETYSSAGLVDALDGTVTGARVEVARSDHGSDALLDGLDRIGAYHHETVLYRLLRPPESGTSTELAAARDLAAILFTSSLTVEHFLDAATERGIRERAVDGLSSAVVGAIGDPTRSTAEANGIEVDVVPSEATAEALVRAVADRLSRS